MQFTFDLISDLHVDTWPTEFDWTDQATSPYCILAGDVCSDRPLLYKTLAHLGQCYQAVFYVDGNDEHSNHINQLGVSYRQLAHNVKKIPDVVYLQDNVIVVNGIAILGTNGWWGYDFDLGIDAQSAAEWHQEKENLTDLNVHSIKRAGNTDATYMMASVKKLQTHRDVKKIIMVTHTVPLPELIYHDIELADRLPFNAMGNRFMQNALEMDTEHKIDTWCFGHYHGKIDQYREGVRYVNNCRGRGNTPYSQYAYHPLRITVEY